MSDRLIEGKEGATLLDALGQLKSIIEEQRASILAGTLSTSLADAMLAAYRV